MNLVTYQFFVAFYFFLKVVNVLNSSIMETSNDIVNKENSLDPSSEVDNLLVQHDHVSYGVVGKISENAIPACIMDEGK